MKLYGTMEKSIATPEDAEYLYLEGTATTSSIDEEFDQILTKGITYKLPLQMLAHHDRKLPVGQVYAIERYDDKLLVKARVPLKSQLDYVDTAVRQIRAGLINAFSVGLRVLKQQANKVGGISVIESVLDELSIVALPGNREATILVVKSLFQDEGVTSVNKERIKQIKTRAAQAVIGTTKHLKKEY